MLNFQQLVECFYKLLDSMPQLIKRLSSDPEVWLCRSFANPLESGDLPSDVVSYIAEEACRYQLLVTCCIDLIIQCLNLLCSHPDVVDKLSQAASA